MEAKKEAEEEVEEDKVWKVITKEETEQKKIKINDSNKVLTGME